MNVITTNNTPTLPGKAGAIFDILESRFAKGYYKFGEILSPSELADEFGVSLQPLRMALSQLRALGFIIVTPQVDCKVVSPTPDDVEDFFLLFAKMEGVMARLATERHDESDLKRLRDITSRLLDCITADVGLTEEYSDLVGSWHTTVRDMARSPTLSMRLKSAWKMSDFLLWQGAPTVPRESLKTASRQRIDIVNAIAARDSAKAESLMVEYVRTKPHRVKIPSNPA